MPKKEKLWILLGILALAHVTLFMAVDTLFPQVQKFVDQQPLVILIASVIYIAYAFKKLGNGA